MDAHIAHVVDWSLTKKEKGMMNGLFTAVTQTKSGELKMKMIRDTSVQVSMSLLFE